MYDSRYSPGALPKGLDPFTDPARTRALPYLLPVEVLRVWADTPPLPSGTRPLLPARPTLLQGAAERTGEKPRSPYPFLSIQRVMPGGHGYLPKPHPALASPARSSGICRATGCPLHPGRRSGTIRDLPWSLGLPAAGTASVRVFPLGTGVSGRAIRGAEKLGRPAVPRGGCCWTGEY